MDSSLASVLVLLLRSKPLLARCWLLSLYIFLSHSLPRTFCKWLNSKLETKGIPPMTSLASDLSDGVKLIQVSQAHQIAAQ
jgi:hypothetical protein